MQNHYLSIWLLIQNIRKVMIESLFYCALGAVVPFILAIYLKK